MGRSDKQSNMGLRTHQIHRGAYGVVRLSDEAREALEALSERDDETGIREATTIDRYLRRFAELGPSALDNAKMLKPLGRFKDGTGRQIQVFEFKAYQWRLYGVCRHFDGAPAFIGLCVDADKKQNKGDRTLMERCARMASRLG